MAESPSGNREAWLALLVRLAKTASRRSADPRDTVELTELEDMRVAERRAYHRYQMAPNA